MPPRYGDYRSVGKEMREQFEHMLASNPAGLFKECRDQNAINRMHEQANQLWRAKLKPFIDSQDWGYYHYMVQKATWEYLCKLYLIKVMSTT